MGSLNIEVSKDNLKGENICSCFDGFGGADERPAVVGMMSVVLQEEEDVMLPQNQKKSGSEFLETINQSGVVSEPSMFKSTPSLASDSLTTGVVKVTRPPKRRGAIKPGLFHIEALLGQQ